MFEAVVTDEIGTLGALSSTRATEDVDHRDVVRGECRGVFIWGRELGVVCGRWEGRHLGRTARGFEKGTGSGFVLVEFLSSLLVPRFGSSVGSVFDHKNVRAGTCAEDEDEGPNLEASRGIIGGSRSASNVGSKRLVGLEDRGRQDGSSQSGGSTMQ